MKSICFVSSFFFLSLLFLFPASSQAQNKDAVGSVGSQKITYSELLNSYSNGNVSDISLSDLKEYLPLYLDYKAKLLFAEDSGYFDNPSLLQEHEMYSKQAAYAHWLSNEIKPTLFDQFFQRAQVEVKSFHILIALPQNASDAQEQEIIQKLRQAKAEIENGTDLQEVDKKYSTIRGNRSMGGDIPWVSAGMLIKDFEDQLFELEIGEVSEPFKTQFGYHIVLLQDIHERTPEKKISHIYVRPSEDSTALVKINNAFEALEEGKNWNDVVKNFSDDRSTADGNIGWVGIKSRFNPDFIEQVRNLELNKTYSKPIKTSYGYHIFKVDSIQSLENKEKWKADLMDEFENSSYFQENNAFAVNYLLKNYGTLPDQSLAKKYEQFLAESDSGEFRSIKLHEDLSSETLLSFDGQEYSVGDFHSYLIHHHGSMPVNSFKQNYITDYSQFVVDEQIIDFTLKKYPSFADEVESYLNGLVVYQVNNDFIWSAETVDSTRLRKIYQNESGKYTYPKRPHYYMISARHDSLLNKAVEFIKSGNSPDSLWNEFNRITLVSDSINTYSEEPFTRLQRMKSNTFSDTFEYNNLQNVFYLKEWLPARRMTFEEAFSRLLTEFQPVREKEWLSMIRKKYKVTADLNKLTNLFQERNK